MATVHIDRDGGSVIIGVFAREQYSGQETIDSEVQEVLDFLDPEQNVLISFKDLARLTRDQRLKESDAYKTADYPKGAVTDATIDTYREDLRNVPAGIASIPGNGLNGVTWPTDPFKTHTQEDWGDPK